MGYYETNVQRVASLWIDAPELKADLTTIANAIDKKLPESEIIKAGTAFRSAFVKLATHVYQHCQVSISDVPLTKRDNYIFDHFEKLQCSLSAKELNELREVFQSVGNDASHPGHPLAAKNITKWRIQDAFEKILAYIGLWITKYAPNELRQPTPWKDPHLDAIAAYKVRARNRFKELMGEEIPEGCYIDRKAKFLDRGGDETPPKDAVELLKWTTRRNARRARALNEPAINELIEKVPRSLLLAHAGMGKSIEAAALADRLTCISDGSCSIHDLFFPSDC